MQVLWVGKVVVVAGARKPYPDGSRDQAGSRGGELDQAFTTHIRCFCLDCWMHKNMPRTVRPGICMVKLSESRMSGSSACFCFVNPLPTLVQTSLSVRNDQAQCYSTLLLGTEAKVRSHSAARLRQRSAVLLAASSGDRSQRDACLLMVTKERIHFWNS